MAKTRAAREKSSERTFAVLLLVVGLAVVSLQPSCLLATINAARCAAQSPHWPQVEGEIVVSEVVSNTSRKALPKIVYRYTIDGKEFTATRIAFAQALTHGFTISYSTGNAEPSTTNRGLAQKLVATFPRGKKVVVFYSPQDPSLAVLRPGSGGGPLGGYILCALGFLVSFGAIFAGIWLWKQSRKDPARAKR